jgi:hypothetical protein
MSQRRTTGKHADECSACYGLGQNEKCATVVRENTVAVANGETKTVFKTVQLGSGCLKCGGIGRINRRA